jgi:ubiquitin carboxyl-terminal hydrolase 8
MVTAQPDVDRNTPVNVQLERAEGYISSSRRAIDFQLRPDLAYKDYLRGYDVVVNYIPRHKDFGFYCDQKKGWESRYKTLLRTVQDMEPRMQQVRLQVQDDNAKRRSQPIGESASGQSQIYSSGFGVTFSASSKTLSMPSPPRNIPEQLRPAVRPKPQSMHGNAVGGNDLSQRFARLRIPSNGQDSTNSASVTDETLAHNSSASQTNGTSTTRPSGPRDMSTNSDGPSIPPKIPLNTRIPPKIPLNTNILMPKPPSPTYSPSKVTMSNVVSNPPRSSAESHGTNHDRRQMYYNQPNSGPHPLQVQRAREDNPYRPRTPNGVNSAIVTKSSSSEIPYETAISAETLVEYIRKYNVLIIDVREREIFDDGHIFSKSIICIEPVALKEGVSAEELEERLVVSPESEQSLFERRNEFDIVVYHDQRTNHIRYLSGPPTGNNAPALRALYDTLYEFNDYKPLRDGRPPALLLGGIDAWVDLMSTNSLATSKTAALMGSTRRRYQKDGSRPIGRNRMVSANSSLEVRKRRLREYKPLNPDEADAWRQKAQEEEIDTNEYLQEGSDGDVDDLEPNSPFVHDYESFLRKFPDVNGMQQSMTMPMPSRTIQPPQRYDYPSAPAVLSRPPPAVPRPSYSGQAEISSSQAPLARQTSAMRPPLYASSSIARRLKLPRTGLTNFGVTCYMNSTLQCLSATMPLSQFFLEDRYKAFLQHNWKGSDGIMPDLYTNLIRSLWRSDVEVIKPTTFRKFCGRMNREWGIERQQDAKEFFDFLVDCLHEDLNINWTRTPLKPLTTAEEMQRERTQIEKASQIEWDRYSHRDYSFVSSLFAGQHASRLRCTTCRNTSTTYEAFYSISVEIPQSGTGNIYDCLRSYCQEEMLSGDEVWKCPYCRCEREATKQIILTRLPQFLVIHFKRFSASKTESARKIHTPIEFPLYGLNMDKYMIPRPRLAITDGETKVDAAITPPFSYDAYGVLRHLGSTGNGGHYISMVRDPGRGIWRRYDDERTADFDPAKLAVRDRLTNHEAYIVFYQRQVPR